MQMVYVDTSVFGGYFDEEFQEDTRPFFEEAQAGLHKLIVSVLTLEELEPAPERVRKLTEEIPLELVSLTEEALQLGQKYVEEGAVSSKYLSDAVHIALATLNRINTIASWNFKHMVNVNRIRQYNAINLKYGYHLVDIRTPKELLHGNE